MPKIRRGPGNGAHRVGLFLSALGLAASLRAHGGKRHDFRLVNGRWFDGRGFVERTVYTVDGVFRDAFDGPVEATLDLSGKWIVPPFADAHNHELGSSARAAEEIRALLKQGVFYVKNPNNVPRWTEAVRPLVNRPTSVDVAYANGGVTASGGHPIPIYESIAERGDVPGWTKADMAGQAFFVADGPGDLPKVWAAIRSGRPDFLKVYLEHSEEFARRRADPAFSGRRGLDPDLLPALVRLAHDAGLTVTAHVASPADVHAALVAGVDELAHLPLGRIADEDVRLAARSGTTVVTTTLSHRNTEGIHDLDAIHRDNLARLAAAGVRLAIGIDGPLPIAAEAENLRRLRVFDDATLLKLWTMDTPRAIFPKRAIGSLAPGSEASFLALEGNPLEDFGAVRRVALRMKQGYLLEVAPSIADPVARAMETSGAAEAARTYRALKQEKPEGFDFSEPELNRLGYQLLKLGRAAEAAAIFRLNAEAYPNSPNAFDSLAEALDAAGDREGAQAAARAVLRLLETVHLDPGFARQLEQNAKRVLAPR